MREVKTKADQKHYPVECCVCGYEFSAAKSIFQTWGMNDAGHGSCPQCKEFLNLTYVPHEEKMISKKWYDYLKERRNDDYKE